MEIIIGVFIFSLGAIIGSFLNVCIFRIPKEESIAFPPSHCGNCNTKLKGKDLVPVLSYILLKGRCRYCKDKVSIQYPIIEGFTGILFMILYLKYGLTLALLSYISLTSILIVIGIIDYKTQYVYTSNIITGIIFGIIFVALSFILGERVDLINVALGAFIPALILAVIVWTTNAMGWGDVEIIFMTGIFLGLKLNLLNLFISIVLGGSYAIYLMLCRKKSGKEEMAFGPYIAVATYITILFGEQILNWYMGTFF
ncbi:MAG: prepilin peptidase [Clostridium sp.]|uniref:prepilin peptidase n=1 Tax=Clostridium sp. TaxID=1506 RepID=UPI003F3D3C20